MRTIWVLGYMCIFKYIKGKTKAILSKPMATLGLGWIQFHKAITKPKRTFDYGSWFSTSKGMQLFINKPWILTKIHWKKINKGHQIFEPSKYFHLLVFHKTFPFRFLLCKNTSHSLQRKLSASLILSWNQNIISVCNLLLNMSSLRVRGEPFQLFLKFVGSNVVELKNTMPPIQVKNVKEDSSSLKLYLQKVGLKDKSKQNHIHKYICKN